MADSRSFRVMPQLAVARWGMNGAGVIGGKSKYRPDGVFISGRATRGMDRFSVARQGEQIVVDIGAMHKQDQDQAGWDAAVVHL